MSDIKVTSAEEAQRVREGIVGAAQSLLPIVEALAKREAEQLAKSERKTCPGTGKPHGKDVKFCTDCFKPVAKSEGLTKVTPPGISESLMHKLKREYKGDKSKAYATAWAIENKSGGDLDKAEPSMVHPAPGTRSAKGIRGADSEMVQTPKEPAKVAARQALGKAELEKNAMMGYGGAGGTSPAPAAPAPTPAAAPMMMAEGEHTFTNPDHMGRCSACQELFQDIAHHPGKKVGDFTGFGAWKSGSNGRDGGLMGIGPSYSMPITDARMKKAEDLGKATSGAEHIADHSWSYDKSVPPPPDHGGWGYMKAPCKTCGKGILEHKDSDLGSSKPAHTEKSEGMEKATSKEGLPLAGGAIPPPAPGAAKPKLPGMTPIAPVAARQPGSIANINHSLARFKSLAHGPSATGPGKHVVSMTSVAGGGFGKRETCLKCEKSEHAGDCGPAMTKAEGNGGTPEREKIWGDRVKKENAEAAEKRMWDSASKREKGNPQPFGKSETFGHCVICANPEHSGPCK